MLHWFKKYYKESYNWVHYNNSMENYTKNGLYTLGTSGLEIIELVRTKFVLVLKSFMIGSQGLALFFLFCFVLLVVFAVCLFRFCYFVIVARCPILFHYEIKLVKDLWQVGGFLRVLRFPPPIKLTATI